MDAITDLFDPVRDALGGGNLTVWLVVGAVVLLWLAVKAVKMVVKMVLGGVGIALLLGAAPWTGEALDTPAAACAAAEVTESAGGWQTNLTKRVTTEEVSPDATCQADGQGLATGTAVVRLRTFYDVPFQTWQVTPQGAEANFELPTRS